MTRTTSAIALDGTSGVQRTMFVIAGCQDIYVEQKGWSPPEGPKTREGFSNGDGIAIRHIPTKHRWFVEKVFGEQPTRIEEDRVTTHASNE